MSTTVEHEAVVQGSIIAAYASAILGAVFQGFQSRFFPGGIGTIAAVVDVVIALYFLGAPIMRYYMSAFSPF